jgi:hypothetical protein
MLKSNFLRAFPRSFPQLWKKMWKSHEIAPVSPRERSKLPDFTCVSQPWANGLVSPAELSRAGVQNAALYASK